MEVNKVLNDKLENFIKKHDKYSNRILKKETFKNNLDKHLIFSMVFLGSISYLNNFPVVPLTVISSSILLATNKIYYNYNKSIELKKMTAYLNEKQKIELLSNDLESEVIVDLKNSLNYYKLAKLPESNYKKIIKNIYGLNKEIFWENILAETEDISHDKKMNNLLSDLSIKNKLKEKEDYFTENVDYEKFNNEKENISLEVENEEIDYEK